MRVLGLDFEATDKIPETARITEIGAAIFDGNWNPATPGGVFSTLVYDAETYPAQSEEVLRVTGITDDELRAVGKPPALALQELQEFAEGVDLVVSYNTDYDKTLLLAECERLGLDLPLTKADWLCAYKDAPWPAHFTCRKLSHLALDHGLIVDPNMLHRAVGDVALMGKLLQHGGYTVEKLLEYRKIPWIVVRAMTGYEERHLAKEQRYSWEKIGDKQYPRCWVKRIKLDQLEAEQHRCPFKVVRIE